MQLSELIEVLQELAETHPDAEVQVAQQPSYPLAGSCHGVTLSDGVVYVVSGEATDYASRHLWEQAECW